MRSKNEKGFSLLELMVAAVLTVGLMGGIFALVNRNQQVFVTESGVTDMNQNVRTAVRPSYARHTMCRRGASSGRQQRQLRRALLQERREQRTRLDTDD